MEPREELKKTFDQSFFPANKRDLITYACETGVDVSKEVMDLVNNLEDDDNFKYNSVDEILPTATPNIIYPIFISECNGVFAWMIISASYAIYIKAGDYIDPAIQADSWTEEFIQEKLKEEKRITKEEFIKKFDEVHQMLKQQIYD